jgi:hypothetical protein
MAREYAAMSPARHSAVLEQPHPFCVVRQDSSTASLQCLQFGFIIRHLRRVSHRVVKFSLKNEAVF